MAVRAYPIGVALKVVLGVFAVVVAVTVLAGAATARRPHPAAKVVLAAIDRQAAKGHLTPAEASRYRATVNRTALLARRLPPSRAALLQSQLEQAAGIASILTAPRALAIFTQLDANDDWFARHGSPAPQSDITDADGVVYRYFPGKGFEFHPLGNFAALNAAVASKSVSGDQRSSRKRARCTRRARCGRRPGAGSTTSTTPAGAHPGAPASRSAVAAQSFARAAVLDKPDAATFLAAARAAYRASGPPRRADALQPLDQALQLQPRRRRPERPAPDRDLACSADYAKSTSDALPRLPSRRAR